MSKVSVAPKPKEPKPDRETLPLASVAITVTRPRLFNEEQKDVPVTISGERLGEILRWATLACPNLEYFTKADIIGLELAGIAETCLGLGTAELHMRPVDCHAVFSSLGDRLRDLAHRMNAAHELVGLRGDSITITRVAAPPEEVA